ncbi:hypothetical protein [Sunxiuqinia elliptica]|uniref:Uncharacterized protein n=1 Tax=Sunxiuqinia elliptica TaxID=655355 RepID=A0A1I2GLS1_9BACT|nr:hypothetical protein [Sunxiuqinia elliptica]SFF17551.1 hypothetical protein SAMN05216283_1034 [Sunxiuqinia elliptica]
MHAESGISIAAIKVVLLGNLSFWLDPKERKDQGMTMLLKENYGSVTPRKPTPPAGRQTGFS